MKTWTPKQKIIYADLKAGLKNSEIVKKHKVAPSYVSNIKNAMVQGEHPPEEEPKSSVKTKSTKTAKAPPGVIPGSSQNASTGGTSQVEKQTVTMEPPAVTEPASNPAHPPSSPPAATIPAGREAVAARISIQPVNIALTPTMYNVKSYLVQRLGWNQNTPWEDIIDNVFAKYFDSIGIIMRGWYEKAEFGSPKPASGSGNGPKQAPPPENSNGHKVATEGEVNTESEEFKKLVRMVSKGMVVLAKQNQLGDL